LHLKRTNSILLVDLPTATFTMTSPTIIVKLINMSVTIQFFASLREQVGQPQATVQITTPLAMHAVWALATKNLTMPDNTLCAINMEYVKPDALVNDGDEVAFFPPVTGG